MSTNSNKRTYTNSFGNGDANNINDQSSSLAQSSEKAVQQTPTETTDDNLIELSEALTTVSEALKGSQAEAAEWKKRYEMERSKNREFLDKASSNGVFDINKSNSQGMDHSVKFPRICSHELLQDGESSSPNGGSNKMRRKASFKLSWVCKRQANDQHKKEIVSFESGNITTAERSSSQISLTWNTNPQTVLIFTKPNSVDVQTRTEEVVRWLREQKGVNIYVEPRVKADLLLESTFFDFLQTWKDDKEISLLQPKPNLVITLGGDGTVLWAASKFKGPVPPIVPFAMGSLGFMTPFQIDGYQKCLEAVLEGPVSITLRPRLKCSIIRDKARQGNETEEDILVLNEVTIDRGITSYLTNLNCYFDGSFVTCVQGDGLILSTTSGSTAYSLAAGGSMVHPQVPGILFTPVCPHSLSFRPLILPDHVTVKVMVPEKSRSSAWVSFDGKGRKQLDAGDALECSMAMCPVSTACEADATKDFLRSIRDGLHWNLRKTQSSDGPRDT